MIPDKGQSDGQSIQDEQEESEKIIEDVDDKSSVKQSSKKGIQQLLQEQMSV